MLRRIRQLSGPTAREKVDDEYPTLRHNPVLRSRARSRTLKEACIRNHALEPT